MRICLSLYGSTEEIVSAIQSSNADMFEIRLDLSDPPDGSRIRQSTERPLIFTAHGSRDLLLRYQEFANYLDVEQHKHTFPGTIVSIHAREQDPGRLYRQYDGSHITKIVLETENYSTIASLLKLNQQHRPNSICYASGDVGAFSRILSTFHGAPWIYTSLPGRPTGDGQITLPELLETYRLRRFPASACAQSPFPYVFGIVGGTVAHSKSPEIQNRFFAEANLPWIYLPFPCKNLPELFRTASEFGIRGFSITNPYKEAVVSLLAKKTDDVTKLRSCNTIYFQDGLWEGMNTDVEGVRALIQRHSIPVDSANIVILGAGGAARTIAFAVRERSKSVTFLNRTIEHAEIAARDWDARAGSIEELAHLDYDVLFQATPVGWIDDECPIDPQWLKTGKVVVDSIYRTTNTLLLQKAESLGCRTVNGKTWFEVQARAQFHWWRRCSNQ